MVTILELFFLQPDHKNFYGHKFSRFGKSILGFQKWTKINVQNRKAKILFSKRVKKPRLHVEGPFFAILPARSFMDVGQFGLPALSRLEIYIISQFKESEIVF